MPYESYIGVRLPSSDRDMIVAAAGLQNVSVSEFVRRAATTLARLELQDHSWRALYDEETEAS